ncbi:hypothetical protein RFI_07482 [Reticulomyxa filosa]|uniref:Uncharacterized protein n=1 Tax=Reticulomyxa filosa TaxID=46433 RepID=X6NV11_RETFI|nr:hypothetical protein RFI_07482 [Reticulomyxa filosa]|eukprot:ETO29639.1 hypothetical protein RFI_07482 [Reticulomyxa filosa]
MFSRFPKFSFSNTAYRQDAIDDATLGKGPIPSNESNIAPHIDTILALMRRFANSHHVQRVACHSLSNLAMQVNAADLIIQKVITFVLFFKRFFFLMIGGFQSIKKAMTNFHNDHKVCWLASSAVWNLARPPANRALIGSEGVHLMLQAIYEHRYREKVVNTAIGSLSNLSLQSDLKDIIGQSENVDILIAVMSQFTMQKSVSVMTSGASLLANIAVSGLSLAKTFFCVLKILMTLLTWQVTDDETIFRNTCAALNNLVSADGFLEHFLQARGIECVFEFFGHNSNDLYSSLLENCLVSVDANSTTKTTSLHLACFHGKLNVLKYLYSQNPDFDLSGVDDNRMTLLDYAISQHQTEIVRFLSRCGATQHSRNASEIDDELKSAMYDGKMVLDNVKLKVQVAVSEVLSEFPMDLCKYMLKFQHNLDLLESVLTNVLIETKNFFLSENNNFCNFEPAPLFKKFSTIFVCKQHSVGESIFP